MKDGLKEAKGKFGDLSADESTATALRTYSFGKPDPQEFADTVTAVVSALKPLAPPPEEARLHGRRHSRERDAAAIAHHYDVSNDFYRMVLGPSLTYSCAVWSDTTTKFYGAASAKGGATSGDGGLIETSSKGDLDLNAVGVDASAANGQGGHWLLDPAQGGRLVGEACHFADFVLFLTGERIRRVFAAGDVAITLDLSGGSSATIHYTGAGDRSTPKERVEAIGSGKVVTIDDFRRVTLNGRTIAKGKGRGHREEMAAFLDAVRGGAPLPGDVDAALEVTEAMFLAGECLRTGESREMEHGGVRGP